MYITRVPDLHVFYKKSPHFQTNKTVLYMYITRVPNLHVFYKKSPHFQTNKTVLYMYITRVPNLHVFYKSPLTFRQTSQKSYYSICVLVANNALLGGGVRVRVRV